MPLYGLRRLYSTAVNTFKFDFDFRHILLRNHTRRNIITIVIFANSHGISQVCSKIVLFPPRHDMYSSTSPPEQLFSSRLLHPFHIPITRTISHQIHNPVLTSPIRTNKSRMFTRFHRADLGFDSLPTDKMVIFYGDGALYNLPGFDLVIRAY